MKKENEMLLLKKATLTAWAKILYQNGTICTSKYNKMVNSINKLPS